MKAQLAAWATRFDAMARRERTLIATALVLGILLLGYALAIEPALNAAKADGARAEQARAETANLTSQIAVLQKTPDPDTANRAALEKVRAELAAGDVRMRELEKDMVPPDKMRAFIESLLAQHRQVELVGLRTLAPAPMLEAQADAVAGAALYKHGVEIRIAGRYEDLVAYLAALEHLPQRILWNKVSLSAEQYPRSVLTVTVYTLSREERWLTV